jgi:hypothetical protein
MVFVLSSYDTQSAGANGAAIIGVYSSMDEAKTKIKALGRLDYAKSDSGLGNIEGDNGKGDEEGRIHYHVKDVQQGGRRRRKTRARKHKRVSRKTRRSRK